MYAEININKKGSVPLTLTIKYHLKKKKYSLSIQTTCMY